MKTIPSERNGYVLLQTLVFGVVAIVVIFGLIAYTVSIFKLGNKTVLSEQAFEVAEAGLEYYRWHLAHAPSDFTNGTGQPGPYVKNFLDKNGVLIGTFTLTITPPVIGSTLVTIKSDGRVAADSAIKRTIIARLSIPSFANYATVTNSFIRFGEGTEVFGPLHSNAGLRLDGLAHNLVTSASSTFFDPDPGHGSGQGVEFGVHTHVNPPPGSGVNNLYRPAEAPPSVVPLRNDVFMAGRSFPAPLVNFSVITSDLVQMKADAQSGGRYFASSTMKGYLVVLKNNDTFDLFRVNSTTTPPMSCSNPGNQPNWGTWSVNATTLLGNYTNPANGLLFLDDNVWVQGNINTARLTIVAARVPDNSIPLRRSITINNNLTYTNYNGQDTLALIGQQDVNVGLVSSTTLRIDAALIAQWGRVGRYYYESDCNPYHIRTLLTLYGTIITANRYGFAYTDGTGYTNRTIIYDAFLLYNPPPFFPEVTTFYDIISWKEE